MERKIAVFYHVYQVNNWREIFWDQITLLFDTGLLEASSLVHIGVNGDLPLEFDNPKFTIKYNSHQETEADTLYSLYDFCQKNPDYQVLYFHTKGVTKYGTSHRDSCHWWRKLMEHHLIRNWQNAVEKLKESDSAGILFREFPQNHYSGNFWWVNADYINRLTPITSRDSDRFKSEFWLGTLDGTFHCLYNINEDFYYNDFSYDKWGSEY